ncbi:hypothetical protein NQ314_016781 [Rhamnusium bicolor]|uniref:Uncharacterized protein n=1 Tax=Rhamnusium bicolor TaxID=1586634 RepID=A0AAV8WUY8_9CUCU|nr:hypothetical protein NQ314_016781 [Rhamnusium bicolor]
MRLYVTANFLLTVGDLINVCKSTSCRIVKKVIHALASLAPQYIRIPVTEEELSASHMKLFAKARLSRVLDLWTVLT